MKPIDFETIKKIEQLSRVSGPLIRMLNERWPSPDDQDEDFIYTVKCVQEIIQTVLDLITAGLL
jgi:uncharacterized UPF0160 family protein